MTNKTHTTSQKGYTLIELLLYITILGSLLTAISLYLVASTTARVKNQAIAEVDRQGALAMDYITRTIRNADSITSPTAGTTSSTLTLVVPNGSLSPTIFSVDGGAVVLGYNQDGGTDGETSGNIIRTTKFVASASGTVTTLRALVGAVGGASNDDAQMAIYSGTTDPTTLLGSSASVALTPSAWNTFTISPVAVTAGQTYWLAYNTNASNIFENNVRFHTGTAGQSRTQPQTFNTWPASFTGLSFAWEFSMYADIDTGGSGTNALQVKEGAAANIALTNDKVVVSNLTFINLSRSGTPGVVRVSFTIERLNPNNRNEYDYQKTFTTTAALRP